MRSVTGDGVLVAVADGVGGGPAGEEASRITIEALDQYMGREVPNMAHLAAAVSEANRRVYALGCRNQNLAGMSTTLTCAVLFPHRLLMAHVGDSRAYELGSDHLTRLTVDHTVAGEMQALGGLTPEEAQIHPNRHVVTRVVGSNSQVRIDASERAWGPGRRLLLCTDGLTSVLTDDDILRLSVSASGVALVDMLISEALTRGGPDNITVVLAEDGGEQDSHGG